MFGLRASVCLKRLDIFWYIPHMSISDSLHTKMLACYKPYLHFHSIYFISITFNMWWTEYRFASHPSDKSFLISSFSGIHFERHTNNNYTLQHIKVYFWVQKVQFQIFVVLVRLWRYVTRILFATVNFETNIQDIPEMISGRKHQESKLVNLGRKMMAVLPLECM